MFLREHLKIWYLSNSRPEGDDEKNLQVKDVMNASSDSTHKI